MNNMIHAEMFKLKRSKALYINLAVIAGVTVLFCALWFMLDSLGINGEASAIMFSGMETNAAFLPFVLFEQMYQLLFLCLAIFVGIDAVKDFQNGCIKNGIMAGRSRVQWFVSKMVNMLIAAVIFNLASTILFTVVLSIKYPWLTPFSPTYMGQLLGFLLAETLVYLAYGSLFVMLSVLIRHTGGAMGACIGYIMAESLVYQLMGLFSSPVLKKIIEIMPISMVNRLGGFARDLMSTGDFALDQYGFIVLVTVGIIAVTSVISVFSLNKRDI